MQKPRFRVLLMLATTLALVAAACSDSGSSAPPATGGGTSGPPAADTVCASADMSAGDLLAKVCDSGKIRVATDPKYPPQSKFNASTNTWEGFDVDVAQQIADRMGLTLEFVTPNWGVITAGSWNDRWDLSVGSMTPIPERVDVLNFTPAYYYVPAALAVYKGSSITSVADLTGKKVGSCGGCTYEEYLKGTLNLPGYTFDFQVQGAQIVTYDTDATGIEDLSLGDCLRLCAMFTSQSVIQGAIDAGAPIQFLGDPLYLEPDAIAIDKSAPADPTAFTDAVSQLVEDMHADGTLSQLSTKWFGVDYTQAPA
jgi:polar amino acid transport system substrate-binding protein